MVLYELVYNILYICEILRKSKSSSVVCTFYFYSIPFQVSNNKIKCLKGKKKKCKKIVLINMKNNVSLGWKYFACRTFEHDIILEDAWPPLENIIVGGTSN